MAATGMVLRSVPTLPRALYAARLERARAAAAEHGYDVLVVYADREHNANLSHLTGFDPRFEEAVLIVGGEGEPGVIHVSLLPWKEAR